MAQAFAENNGIDITESADLSALEAFKAIWDSGNEPNPEVMELAAELPPMEEGEELEAFELPSELPTDTPKKDAWAYLAEAMPDNRNNVIAAHRKRKWKKRAAGHKTFGMRPDTA